jgi:hypothetical protein
MSLGALRDDEEFPTPARTATASGTVLSAPYVSERLNPVRIEVRVQYYVPNERVRLRGGKLARREDVLEERFIDLILSVAATDPINGPQMIAREVAQKVYKRLTWEGWPKQVRFREDDRP